MVENISTGAPHRQVAGTCELKSKKSAKTAFIRSITHLFWSYILIYFYLATIAKVKSVDFSLFLVSVARVIPRRSTPSSI